MEAICKESIVSRGRSVESVSKACEPRVDRLDAPLFTIGSASFCLCLCSRLPASYAVASGFSRSQEVSCWLLADLPIWFACLLCAGAGAGGQLPNARLSSDNTCSHRNRSGSSLPHLRFTPHSPNSEHISVQHRPAQSCCANAGLNGLSKKKILRDKRPRSDDLLAR